MASDLFGARASLPGHPDVFRINRLDETGAADTQRLPHTVRILLEGLLRNAGGLHVRSEDVIALARWPAPPGPGKRVPFFPARVLLQDFTGVPAVVDLAAMRAAMARAGRDPNRVDPLVPCDLVIDHSVQVDEAGSLRRLCPQHRARVRAQRRALPPAALGPGRVRLVPRRPARHGYRPPGQSRAPGPGRGHPRRRRRARHARRHRLAYDDDQRARRARLRRRRHRGRGGHARGAARARHAVRRRRAALRRAARGRHGHRPRAHADRVAAPPRRRRALRRVLRRRPLGALAGRPRDALQHVARVRRHRRALPGRRRGAALPARDRSRRARAARGRAPQGAGAVPARRRSDARLQHARRARSRRASRRASPARAGRRTACRWPTCRRASRNAYPPREAANGTRGARRRRRDRRDHVLHQHVEPLGDGRRGPARPQRRRARPARRPARQDEPRARLARRHRLPRGCRPAGAARRARLPARRLRLHDLHRQLRAALGRDLRGRARGRARGLRRALGQPQLRGPHPPARARELPRLAARSSSPTRSPARSTIDLEHEPLGTDSDGADVYLRDIWPSSGEVRDGDRGERHARAVRARVRDDLGRRRALAGAARARGRALRLGSRLDLRARALVLPGSRSPSRRRSPTSWTRAASSCSATRSRPTTSRPPVRSRATCPPAAT